LNNPKRPSVGKTDANTGALVTCATTMATTVFSVQELCDQIASQLAPHPPDDLKSTALVCHTLAVSAQSQLFRHVILDRDPLKLAHRLCAILGTSPHLLLAIRSLRIRVQPQVLSLVSGLRLPLLREIRLNFYHIRSVDAMDAEFLRSTRDLIGLPSIREVGLSFLGHQDMDRFASLFETCTWNLCSLSIFEVYFNSADFTEGVPRLRSGRPEIKRLKLNGADPLGPWLTSASCLFDFSSLVDVEISAGAGFPLWQFLDPARLHITRLAIFAGDLTVSASISVP
jgi:hypothetical protein